MKKPATLIAVVLLGLVAAAHLVRLVFGVHVVIAGWDAPMWVSMAGLLIPAILSVLVWRERKLG